MATCVRIAVDSMGGDFGLRTSLPAVIHCLNLHSFLEIVLVGDRPAITQALSKLDFPPRLTIRHASQVVAMDEKPSVALRKKMDSSMRVALDMLACHDVDAVVSAGNTGALMAMGRLLLKTLPGIERPAICTSMPALNGCAYLLDLGANVDTTAAQLHQFALMGAAMCKAVDGVASPRIALLNIGTEANKGNEQVKLAAQLLAADSQLNYQGFIEANSLLSGDYDVLVCDGFVGNVALKSCEGTAQYIAGQLKEVFSQGWYAKACALLMAPLLSRLSKKLNIQQYNGASFLGLKGVVVKSHGNSSVESFVSAIEQALFEVENNMITMIESQLNHWVTDEF